MKVWFWRQVWKRTGQCRRYLPDRNGLCRACRVPGAGMSSEPPSSTRVPVESILAILDYNEADEQADWIAEHRPDGHVYQHMLVVRDWLATQTTA